MAAWQIIGYIVFSICGGVVLYGIADMIITLPKLWNLTPAFEEDEDNEGHEEWSD